MNRKSRWPQEVTTEGDRKGWDVSWVTDNDRERSRTSRGLDDLRRILDRIPPTRVDRFLDVGCGYGGLSKLVGAYLGAGEIHGVDIDERVTQEVRQKGVELVVQDAAEGLPYEDGAFEVVMTLGMMDYLVAFDPLIRELNRLVAPSGWLVVTLPNLGSWHNRLSLLAGYQPRDVEISSEILAGVAGYRGEIPAGHIHTPTLRAFVELMQHHGFEAAAVHGGRPQMRPIHPALLAVDKVLSRRPSLARRFFYLGRKVAESPNVERSVDMPYQSLR